MYQMYNQCCESSIIFSSNAFFDTQLKQVSSSEPPSSTNKQSIFSSTKHCPISGRLQIKCQAKLAEPQQTKINTRRTKRVAFYLGQTCTTFVASKNKRKSSFKYYMSPLFSLSPPPSPSSSSSLPFAQSLALLASCCIVATLSLNFAYLILAPNNFINANDISTERRLMINRNHNHRYHHHHYQTSPANQQPRNFNSRRHDLNVDRDSRHKREQNNDINAHLFNRHHKQKQHNYNYHNKQKSLSHQVPEQLPIVVSLSDNSYVSASPVESTTITTTTTNTASEQISPHKNKKHRTRYLLRHLSTSNSFRRRNNHDDTSINHHQQQNRLDQQKYYRHRPSMHDHNNDLLTGVSINNNDGRLNDIERDNEDEEEEEEEEVSKVAQQLTSSSDISTTATTTQSNRDKYHKNLVQMYDSSNSEDQDHDEANKHKGIDAHYQVKSASIIKTRESIDMGATFINYTIVTNLNACLVECWITDLCDTAIYQESPVNFNNNNNIDHLPNSFAKSEEHYSLTSLIEPLHVTQSTLLSKFMDESKAVFNSENIYISDNNIKRSADNKNHHGSPKNLIGDDKEISEADHSNDVDDDDQEDDSDGEYDSGSNNKRSKIINHFKTRLPENGFFICYLFECVKPDGFKCQFSAHNYYVSATKRRDYTEMTAAFTTDPKRGSIEPKMTINRMDSVGPFVRDNISDKTTSNLNNKTLSDELSSATTTIAQGYYCGQNKFKCTSQDQCIPNSYRCDRIVHCSDQSDELDCNSENIPIDSNNDRTSLDGYSIVMSDGSLKSDQILEKTNLQMSHSKDSSHDKVVSKYPLIGAHSEIDNNKVQKLTELDREILSQRKNYILMDETTDNKIKGRFDVDLSKFISNDIEPRYSNVITSHSNYHPINGRQQWHDSHIASIKMSQEEYDYGYQKRGNGMNSAIIAIMFGIGVTGMLVVIVGHKMKSIAKRIAYKGRRRSLVPDMDFLINTMPI